MSNQFDYFVAGEDIPGIVYHATCETRLNNVLKPGTIILSLKDLGTLLPAYIWDATIFYIDPVAHEIREYFDDGSYEVVANSGI